MAATTMHSTNDLLITLQTLRPDITFSAGGTFKWEPETQTITYDPSSKDSTPLLLHEFGHAQCAHLDYTTDIQLLTMEQEAWKHAGAHAGELGIAIEHDLVEEHLDTYRDWIHARSTCPHCSMNGFQTDESHYECPSCQTEWRVNKAISCELRRYTK